MQILTGIQHNVSHNLHGTGAYEWWYIDALSADGQWGVVAILFRGMPMSPSYLRNPDMMLAGCAVSVYHKGIRIAFSFTEYPLESCTFDQKCTHVEVGDSSLVIDQEGILRLHSRVPCDRDGRSIDLAIHGKSPMHAAPYHDDAGDDVQDVHAWVLAQPLMKADVLVALHEQQQIVVQHQFEAAAYHDHNLGKRAMHSDYRHWYWGRVHGDDGAYVFLVTPDSPDSVVQVFAISQQGDVVPWSDVQVLYEKPTCSIMGLLTHKQVVIRGTSKDGLRHELVCKNDQTCEDGPFYQRYISTWIVDGQTYGYGMSEYMYVARMESAWIRPFLQIPLITMVDRP